MSWVPVDNNAFDWANTVWKRKNISESMQQVERFCETFTKRRGLDLRVA